MSKRIIFHELVVPEEALRRIEELVPLRPLGVEEVSLEEAVGRVLAEDVYSSVDVPPFDRATMDGYAVRAVDTFGAFENRPVSLKVIGKVEAGEEPKREVGEGEAVEIATGAPLPKGSDAVVPVEFTKREGDRILIYRSLAPNENVASAGSDIRLGELILREGTVLLEREVGVLAAIGRNKVRVYKRPKVAIISSGNELIAPGDKLAFGRIYDVNTYSIYSAVLKDGGIPTSLGIVRDDVEEIEERLIHAEEEFDVVIISGGTSAGLADLTYQVLDKLGPPGIIVHGLKVKPGKPTVIAVSRNKKPIFGLPGYPNSALMIYDLIVRPIMRKLSGLKEEERKTIKAKLAIRVEGAKGRRGFYPVSLVKGTEDIVAFPMFAESGSISSLSLSDGYITVPENIEFLEEGEEVEVSLFAIEYKPADLYLVGSHDVAVEFILKKLGCGFKIVNVGSLEGIKSVAKGYGDIAGTHLLDVKSMEYNVPFLNELKVENSVLVRGYEREQGIIVAKGNPKGIKSVKDFLRDDVVIVNRTKGSGTRALLDFLLSREVGSLEEIRDKIKGYYTEVKTHSAVAACVKHGRADAGIGIRYVADAYELDFISLGWEKYDFLIRKESLRKRSTSKFLQVLRSEEFKEHLTRMVGYRAGKDLGEIIWEG